MINFDSIYNENRLLTFLKKGVKMSSLFGNGNSNLVFPPKVGASVTVTITDVVRKDCKEEWGYKSKNKAFGYRDEFQLSDGRIMPCSTWKLYFSMRDANVRPGDTITIYHYGRGQYKVDIHKDAEGVEKMDKIVQEAASKFNAQKVEANHGWEE